MNFLPRRRSVAASLVLLPLVAGCGGLLPKPPELSMAQALTPKQGAPASSVPVERATIICQPVPVRLLTCTTVSEESCPPAAFQTSRVARVSQRGVKAQAAPSCLVTGAV